MTSVMELDPIDARDAWLDWRREGIGGSDIAALCGMSRWATPMSIYLDKTGMLDDSDAGEAAQIGRLLETPIAWEFENRTGLHVAGAQLCVVDTTAPWRRATLDGVVIDSHTYHPGQHPGTELLELGLGTFESKASSQFGFEDDIPDEYAVQCQWQMGVTGMTAGWLAILHGGRLRIQIEELTFEPAVFDGLREIADRFWHDHVLAHNPPPADAAEATTHALKDAWRDRADHTPVELDDDVAIVARGLLPARAAVKRAQAELDLIENQLRAALGEHTVGTYAGEEFVTWKPQKTGARLVLDALKAAHPEIVEKFMGEPGTTRVLRPTKALKEKSS